MGQGSLPCLIHIRASVNGWTLLLTRLAAHISIHEARCPLSGRAGAIVFVWCSKTSFLFLYGPDTWPARPG